MTKKLKYRLIGMVMACCSGLDILNIFVKDYSAGDITILGILAFVCAFCAGYWFIRASEEDS